MSAEPCFVDTNVLVYARDASEPVKQPRARAWLDALWSARTGRISAQVLSEFYVTVTRKLDPGMTPDAARADVRDLAAWHPAPIDPATLERAFELEDRFQLSWWDALIVASAQLQGCRVLLSEDLQRGQRFDDVEVVDPFATEPPGTSGPRDALR